MMRYFLNKSSVLVFVLLLFVCGTFLLPVAISAEPDKPLLLLKNMKDEEKVVNQADKLQKVNNSRAASKVQRAKKKPPQKVSSRSVKKPKVISSNLEEKAAKQKGAQKIGTIEKNDSGKALQLHTGSIDKGRVNLFDKAGIEVEKEVKQLLPQSERIVTRFESNSSGAVVTFFWNSPVKAAAFIRNNKLWIIFDQYAELDFQDHSRSLAGRSSILPNKLKLYNLEQYNIDRNATYITADIGLTLGDTNLGVTFSQSGNSWILEVSKQHQRYYGIPLFVRPMALPTPNIELMMDGEITSIIDYRDPVTGNMMSVIPVDTENRRVEVDYKFVDLNLINTIQGAVIERISDDIKISSFDSSIIITSASGLNISSTLWDYSLKSIDDARTSRHSLLNFEDLPKMHFMDAQKYLRHDIITGKASYRPIAKLNFALFYLGNQMYPEAVAYVKMAQSESGLIKISYRATLIHAVAQYMNRRYEKSYDLIDSIDIESVPIVHRQEVMFWKVMIAYKMADSYKYFGRSNTIALFEDYKSNFMQNYPTFLLSKIGFDILGDKVSNGSVDMAQRIITVLKTFKLPESEQNRLYSDTGVLYATQHKINKSIEMFDKCIASRNDPIHYIKCSWLKAKVLHNNNKIASDEFTDQLEHLRVIWRGPGVNGLEMSILKDLYASYNSQNQLLQALRIGQMVLDDYPNTIEALRLTSDMSQLFINYFLIKGQRYDAPLKKLELFYEFKHLLPIGYLGDEVILNIADYLIELDLLNKASDLLEHQVRNRLVGIKKERAINKLMHIYIYNQKPINALKILAFGAPYQDLPDLIAKERRYMSAEALYASGNSEAAINILKGDLSQQADEIKMKILWSEEKWKEFNDFSEPYIYSIRYKDTRLTSHDVIRLLKQSIAYILVNEIKLFEDLYEDFKLRFPKDNKHAKMLSLLRDMLKYDSKGAIEMAKNIGHTKEVATDFVKISGDDV